MVESQVVDMDRWRSRTRVVRPAALAAGAAARVVALPERLEAPGPEHPGHSVFGPVMAFGLLPRDAPPAPAPLALVAADGEDAPVAASSLRVQRARHLPDARGASRGPRR